MKKMINLTLVLSMALLVGCNSQTSEDGLPLQEEETFESEMAKLVSEHDEEVDSDEYDSEETNSLFNGIRRRILLRRFVIRRVRAAFRQDVRSIVKDIFDADNSGELDNSEQASGLFAAKQCRLDIRAAKKAQFDVNNDGRLSLSEWAALVEERRLKRQQLKDQFDENQNGKIDDGEYEALVEHIAGLAMDELLAKHDADEDGKISAEEATAENLETCQPLVDVI